MDIINTLFAGPVLPATLFLGLLLLWNMLALLGAVDVHMPGAHGDLHLPIDAHLPTDAHLPGDIPLPSQVPSPAGLHIDSLGGGAGGGLALLMVKWLNLRQVPFVLWLGVLAVVWWFCSAMLWIMIDRRFFSEPGWMWSSVLVVRNLIIALPLTKLATRPMRGWFATERFSSHSLVGQECRISSSVASPEFGQVKFKTRGSPLLLNVRTDGSSLVQGTPVWITHYDAKRRVYIVSPITPPTSAGTSTVQDGDR